MLSPCCSAPGVVVEFDFEEQTSKPQSPSRFWYFRARPTPTQWRTKSGFNSYMAHKHRSRSVDVQAVRKAPVHRSVAGHLAVRIGTELQEQANPEAELPPLAATTRPPEHVGHVHAVGQSIHHITTNIKIQQFCFVSSRLQQSAITAHVQEASNSGDTFQFESAEPLPVQRKGCSLPPVLMIALVVAKKRIAVCPPWTSSTEKHRISDSAYIARFHGIRSPLVDVHLSFTSFLANHSLSQFQGANLAKVSFTCI